MNRLPAWQASLARLAGTVFSPGGRAGSLLVLIFHRVHAQPDPMLPEEPDAATFAAQMDAVRSVFNVLPLREAVARLRQRSLPPRAVCITFDDGYADNAEVAAPILAERGMPATFFVATGYTDGGRMWNDTVTEAVRRAGERLDLTDMGLGVFSLVEPGSRPAATDALLAQLKYRPPGERESLVQRIAERVGAELPRNLMMTSAQVRKLHAMGMEVGAHSVTHPILTRIDVNAARREIEESRSALESILGSPVVTFAYPNGQPGRDYTREHVEIVRRAGFECAVSTGWGSAHARTDLYQIPRIAPWDPTAARYAGRMLLSYLRRRPPHV